MPNTPPQIGRLGALWLRLHSLRVVIALTVVVGVLLASFFSYLEQTSDPQQRRVGKGVLGHRRPGRGVGAHDARGNPAVTTVVARSAQHGRGLLRETLHDRLSDSTPGILH